MAIYIKISYILYKNWPKLIKKRSALSLEMTMKIITDFSPNHSKKTRLKKEIKFVIIHYTGMQSEIESLKRLKNPKSKVSCHYLINRKGKIFKMVKDLNVAWHAGRSKWKNLQILTIIQLV